jgi:hypothetical protein
MSNQLSNHFKYLLATNAIDVLNDEFRIILMATGFAFNKDTHALYSNVSASELGAPSTSNGYDVGTKVLGSAATVEDDTNDRSSTTWANASWVASGGSIGPSPGAIILDMDTDPYDPCVVGYIDFGAEYTQVDGGTFTIAGIEFRVK